MSSNTSHPTRIGKYEIISHIATGGMGTVYKAQDTELGRVVALKVLAPELASNEVLVERFRREARHAARLQHKNIVLLFECGQADNHHYLAMEFIEGVDLGEYIRRKTTIDPEEARRMIIQACKALECAAAQGITHRDIKPSNFLLANEDGLCRVKLADMGLARMVNEDDFRITRAGTTVGTVDYMPPEQARDSALADTRSDIYALGCTLYHMLTGKPPFAEGGIGERIYKHLAAEPRDVREVNPKVSLGLWTVLRRMLAKHPDDRFQTPEEVIEALRSITNDPVRPSRHLEGRKNSELDSDASFRPPTPVPHSAPLPHETEEVSRESPTISEKRKKETRPKSTLHEMQTVSDAPDPLGVTAEQRQSANGQFDRATEVIRSGGDSTYAVALLLSCCKLDPANLMYRKMLREVVRDRTGGKKGGWFGALTNMPARSRLRALGRAGEHRKVLEQGEELLSKTPTDLPIQLEMAASAEALGLSGLSLWMLEEARTQSPKDVSLLRTIAGAYEERKRYKQAIALWEEVRRLDPSDVEASTKIKNLAANETIARTKAKG